MSEETEHVIRITHPAKTGQRGRGPEGNSGEGGRGREYRMRYASSTRDNSSLQEGY